jgi:hypothetical protein
LIALPTLGFAFGNFTTPVLVGSQTTLKLVFRLGSQ